MLGLRNAVAKPTLPRMSVRRVAPARTLTGLSLLLVQAVTPVFRHNSVELLDRDVQRVRDLASLACRRRPQSWIWGILLDDMPELFRCRAKVLGDLGDRRMLRRALLAGAHDDDEDQAAGENDQQVGPIVTEPAPLQRL